MSTNIHGSVDLVREEPKERLYDREAVEAVLGRDTSSVFPTEIARLAAEERKSAADSLGGRNFITEKELEELRAEQAGPAGEAIVPEKPLAEVLAQAKQAKEDAFQAQWKQMKTGKNRPLDEEELQFLGVLQQQAEQADSEWHAEQARELDAYQQAVRARAEAAEAARDAAAAAASAPQKQQPKKAEEQQKVAPRRPMVNIVRKKPVGGAAAATAAEPAAKRQHRDSGSGSASAGGQTSAAKQTLQQPGDRTAGAGGGGADSDADGGGLAGLLGGYGSDSD